MNCANHNTNTTISICKFCNKGLCDECSHDSEYGVYCGQTCLEKLKELDNLNKYAMDVYQRNRYVCTNSRMLGILLGLVFLSFSSLALFVICDDIKKFSPEKLIRFLPLLLPFCIVAITGFCFIFVNFFKRKPKIKKK